MHSDCDGVVECTALVLAESCTELDGRLTLFGILDEILPDGETSFVVYTKFEGCEHAAHKERKARILITDEEGEILMESAEYPVHLDGTEEPVTIVAAFDLPPDFEVGEQLLWVEAVLDEETLSQTVVRIHDRYSV
ncbi:MAG: hypothetical protein M3Q49_07880 [Actinomycetota bacterium]|nr:hypothetical protein [Actinomycetota bacterium]MDP9485688.1 hypothetical protein [Actinomycetota bacterium]